MLMAEFLTAVRQRLPITVVVSNNNSLGQILWEQMVLGYPEHGVRYREPVADFAAWATACGGYRAKVREPGELAAALRTALAHDGPALVDVDVDPHEPPLPGKSATSRPRASYTPGCVASRTKRPSPAQCSKTASPDCGPE